MKTRSAMVAQLCRRSEEPTITSSGAGRNPARRAADPIGTRWPLVGTPEAIQHSLATRRGRTVTILGETGDEHAATNDPAILVAEMIETD